MSQKSKMENAITRNQKGFTLIELMVGMALGLLASLAIFTAVSSFETQRRVTAAGADMQQNGLLALYFLEQDLRMAGFGLIDASTNPGRLPCVKLNGVGIAPVSIADGGVGSDTITTHRLDSDTGGIVTGGGVTKLTSAIGGINAITVDTNKAIHLNDYLLLPDAAQNCTQLKVTSLPAVLPVRLGTPAVAAAPAIPAIPGVSPAVPAVTAVPAVMAVPATASIINLGQTAASIPAEQYRISANANLEHSTDGGTTWSTVAANIVNLQVQYGIAAAGSQSVTCWTNATGNACAGTNWANPPAADIARIKAIRVAIVARSSQRAAAGTTTVAPDWFGGTIDLSADANWQSYRYKVYQTIIPIRNVIWGKL